MKTTRVLLPLATVLLLAGCAAPAGAPAGSGGGDGAGGPAPAASRQECTDQLRTLLAPSADDFEEQTGDIAYPSGWEFLGAHAPSCVYKATYPDGVSWVIAYIGSDQDEAVAFFDELNAAATAQTWELKQGDQDFLGDDAIGGHWWITQSTPAAQSGHLDFEALMPLGEDFAKATGLDVGSGWMDVALDLG